MASGCAGHDAEGDFMLAELQKYPNIDLSAVGRSGRTSFTLVMSNNETKERTFFQHIGAAATYGEDDIDFDALDVDIFHIGYILLLPHLDEPDDEYGTKMARLLHKAQSRGFKTSIDVVTESGDRFAKLVCPALKYVDYCIINELVAAGKSVIMISSELPEVLGMSDRIYVLNEGKLVGEFTREEASQEKIMACILSTDSAPKE